jgi:pyridoxal phosphate enzyme (YggS family)
VELVAVSKTKPNADIIEAYNVGQRIFGENKVQELVRKDEELPKDIEWHMIGHLQTNKVKYIAPFIKLIHSIDSLKLLRTVNLEAQKNNRTINCLLQCKIAEEDTKFGLSKTEMLELLRSEVYTAMKNIQIVGIMGMASHTANKDQVRQEFRELKDVFNELKSEMFSENSSFSVLSMGMSHDYLLAIEEGATMVRVGSSIFGNRNY